MVDTKHYCWIDDSAVLPNMTCGMFDMKQTKPERICQNCTFYLRKKTEQERVNDVRSLMIKMIKALNK